MFPLPVSSVRALFPRRLCAVHFACVRGAWLMVVRAFAPAARVRGQWNFAGVSSSSSHSSFMTFSTMSSMKAPAFLHSSVPAR